MMSSSPERDVLAEESELRDSKQVSNDNEGLGALNLYQTTSEAGKPDIVDMRAAGSVEEFAEEKSSDFSTIESAIHPAENAEEQGASTQKGSRHSLPSGKTTPSEKNTVSTEIDSIVHDGKLYHDFYWDCMELKAQLIRLAHSLRSIGSSGPLTKATYALKDATRKLRDVYGKNAASLFPDNGNYNIKEYKSGGSFVYLREFLSAFKDFRDALDEMAPALHDFSSTYHDEKLVLQLISLHSRFEDEVAKILSNTAALSSQSASEMFAKQMQIVLADWLMEAIASLTGALKTFTDKGVPAIQGAQSFSTSRYLDMTTIAVLLSGTTASMLQITVDESGDTLRDAATTCLFASLIFSVGSALNSLLVIGWRKSVVRNPDSSLPLWLKVCFSAGSMISLLLSGVSFALGVCLFVFTAGNRSWTSAITVALTGLHASLLVLLFSYFIRERWSFNREAGLVGGLTIRALILSGLEWLFFVLTPPSRSYPRQMTPSRAESGVAPGMELMNVTENSESGGNSGSDNNLTYPKSIWHSLSDETFILGAKYQSHLITSKPFESRRPPRPPSPGRQEDEVSAGSEGGDMEGTEISSEESDSGQTETETVYTSSSSSFGIVRSAAMFLPSGGIRHRIRRD